jgi:HK97 family phage major capsid protein
MNRMVDLIIRERQALGVMTPAGATAGERYTASDTYGAHARGGILSRSETTVMVRSSAELAARLRTDPDPVTYPQAPGNDLLMAPASGGRVLPLCRIVPDAGDTITVAVESDRTEAAAPTPYGTALPEASIAFADRTAEASRLGTFVTLTGGVWRDAGSMKRVIDTLADDEWSRIADVQILNGSGTGEALTGILQTADLPTQAYTTATTRFHALLKAALTVRASEYGGRISVVTHPDDALQLVTEETDDGASTFRPDVLDRLDIGLVVSSLIPTGTALVGDYHAGATVYLRSGVEVSASTQHGTDLTAGIVRVSAEARADLTVRVSAFVSVTGL